MQRVERIYADPKFAGVIGVAAIGVFVALLFLSMAFSSYDLWGAFLVGPILFLVTLPLIAYQARMENDRKVFWFLTMALLLKFAGGIARHYVAFDVYGGVADATGYHSAGTEISENLWSGELSLPASGLGLGTRIIQGITGIIYTITGPTLLGGFLFYSWLGFIGIFLAYRAFHEGVGFGERRIYARFVFLLPSMLFWPSSIGKEAWMLLTLGLVAYGAARFLARGRFDGLIVASLGLGAAGIVRAHIAGIALLALIGAYILKRSERSLREFVLKLAAILCLAGLGAAALLILGGNAPVDLRQGLGNALESTAERTMTGGSSYDPPLMTDIGNAPLAVWTVLFRPHPLEVENLQGLMIALEGAFLFVFSVVRVTRIGEAVRRTRDHPYIAFALIYTVLAIAAFSAFGNFGLLARQRVQILPFYVLLLAIPRGKKEHG